MLKSQKFSLKNGAEVNARQYSLSKRYIGNAFDEQPMLVSGRLPIHWAAIKRHSTVVEVLLQYGANPNARNTAGRPVLQEACMKRDSNSVRLLLQHGADVDTRCYSGVCQFASFGSLDYLTSIGMDRGPRSCQFKLS